MATAIEARSTAGRSLRQMRGRTTVACGLALSALYGLYAMTVTPLLRPAGLNEAGPQKFDPGEYSSPGPIADRQQADRWLASEPWAAQPGYSFRSNDAVLYFNHWEPADDNQAVRFRPFAMIWRSPDSDESTPPTVIISDSAWLRFAGKFDMTGSNPGRIVGGALEGRVQISGNNKLKVEGRNFVFSEDARRLWSDAAATFTYGLNHGQAHGVQVELYFVDDVDQGHSVDQPSDSVAVTGIRSIRLRRDVVMDLVSEGGESMAMAGMAAPPSAPDAAESPPVAEPLTAEPPAGERQAQEPAADAQPAESKRETINIRSAGPFEFVIETNIATFEDDVRVYRPTGPDQYDSLECGLLTLQFESVPESPGTPPAAPSTASGPGTEATVAGGPENAAAATESDFRGVDENLTFRRMRAEGPQVVLHSQGSGMRAFMTEFVYDARSRLAELVSPGGLVRVLRSDSELQSPRIQMAWNEDNEISSMRCQGAGWLRYVDEDTGRLQLAAEWKTELRQYPENNGGLDLIELVDNATVRQPEQQMGLAAQFIRLWVDRQQQADKTAGGPPEKNKDSRAAQFHLDRMLALREVAMVSPQMEAESNRLEVWFEDVPAAPAGESSGRKPENVRTVSVTSSAPGQPAGPSAAQPKPGERARNAQAPEDGPIRIRAELIRVRVVRQAEAEATAETNATAPPFRQVPAGAVQPLTVEQEARQNEEGGLPQGGNHQVAEVWTQGNVIVRQDHLDGQAPLEVTGEELHLRNNSEHGQLLTVIGQPAHIRDRSMHIEGQHVELDRAANRATVQGSGLLQFPVSSTLDGKKLATPQMFDVWWKEQMTFDGQSAKFFGGVKTVIADSRMICQEMEVQLTRRISFIEPETGPEQADRPEIQNVVCRHGVEFESYEYAEQKLVEIRSGHFAEFSVDQTTGDTKGTGPGWIAFWRRGSGRRPGLGGASTAQANRSARAADAGWDYTRIDFSRQNLGNLERRHTTFDDRVQVVYGPVEKPLDVIDVDELPKEAGSMQCSTLQMTQHPGDDKTPAWVELLGTGDTKVDGRSFHARADTISYDESKGLYMLRSLGSRKATIWRQKSAGGESSRADAQRMEFIPARNQLKLDRTTGLNGLQ